MNTLFEKQACADIMQRLNTLQPDSKNQWGKMNVAQMLAHCVCPLEVALGEKSSPRSFMAKVLGPFFKGVLTNDKPFGKSAPTDPTFVVADQRDFETEKTRLQNYIQRFQAAPPAAVAQRPHQFLGKITAEQWGMSMYKHLDHHFRQFGA